MKLAESKPKANIPSPAKTPPARSAPVLALHDETRCCLLYLPYPLGHCRRPEASAWTETPGLSYFSAQPPFRARGGGVTHHCNRGRFRGLHHPGRLRLACIPPLGLAFNRAGKSKPYLERLAPMHLNWHLCKAWPLLPPSLLRWWRCSAEPVRPRARAMLHRRPPTTPRLSVRQPCCTLLS